MPKARVMHGKYNYKDGDGNRVSAFPGDVVEVSDTAMVNFKDLLAPVVEEPAASTRRPRGSGRTADVGDPE